MFQSGVTRNDIEAIAVAARVSDVLAILAAGIVAYDARIGIWPMLPNYQVALLLTGLLVLVVFPGLGLYRSLRERGARDELGAVLTAWVIVVLMVIALAFLTKTGTEYSRLWMIGWALGGGVALPVFRVLVRLGFRVTRRDGAGLRNVLIVGAGALGQEVARRIQEAAWTGLSVVGFLDDDPELRGKQLLRIEVRGSLDALAHVMDRVRVDEIWIALPLRAEDSVRKVLNGLEHRMIPIRYVPDVFGLELLNHSFTSIAGIPVIEFNASPMIGANRIIKAIEDRVIATLILALASPLFAAIALGVKLSSQGPVIFRQQRLGWDGKPFQIYKFRTMVEHDEPDGKVTQARKNDIRVTKFGRFLRHTSLDELPQFVNVLQGYMSIVGPRPHALVHNEQYKDRVDAYMLRHKVKPGITGWAQVNGLRGETDDVEKMKLRVQHDLYYINNWSVWFDLKIIVMTLFKGLVNKNAY